MIYSFLYILIASMGLVLTEFLDTSVPPLFSLFFASLIAAIFFNIINLGKLRQIYQACWQQKWLYLAIMLTILIMWYCSIVTPGLLGASLYNFLYFTWLGMLGFFSLCLLDWKKNHQKLYFGLGALALITAAVWIDLDIHASHASTIGLLLSFVGGTSAFVYFKQSQLLMKRIQLSATQILAVRFYLTIIISFVMLPKTQLHIFLTTKNLLEVAVLAILTMIVPLFFQQKALEKITVEQNSIIMSLTPIATGLLQELIFKNVSLAYIAIYLCYTLLVAFSYILNYRKNFKEKV